MKEGGGAFWLVKAETILWCARECNNNINNSNNKHFALWGEMTNDATSDSFLDSGAFLLGAVGGMPDPRLGSATHLKQRKRGEHAAHWLKAQQDVVQS